MSCFWQAQLLGVRGHVRALKAWENSAVFALSNMVGSAVESDCMKLVQLMFKRETLVPMLALSFASMVSVVLVIGRIIWTRDTHYGFLIWNLFLAWMPIVFAMLAREHQKQDRNPGWRFIAFGTAWLLFFPNAPYIFTDVIHLGRVHTHFWPDLILILINALTGMVLGFLSLFLMQSAVRRLVGGWMSWLFIGAVAMLSGFGIYIGRFMRLNSWDVVTPGKMVQVIGTWTRETPWGHSLGYSILFAAFLFVTYLMLYALTHLSPAHLEPAPRRTLE
jgi:uncharacterized membrane protein